MRLLLTRHGETTSNVERRIQGQLDVPLTEAGRAQADRLAGRLADAPLDAIIASPLRRAWDTAQAVAAHHRVPLRQDPRLMEICYGQWQGSTWAEVRRRDPQRWQTWTQDPANPPPDGESFQQAALRVGELLKDLSLDHEPDCTLLLVGHGGSLRMLVCVAFGIPIYLHGNLAMDNTAVSELEVRNRGAVLVSLNDTTHLRSLNNRD